MDPQVANYLAQMAASQQQEGTSNAVPNDALANAMASYYQSAAMAPQQIYTPEMLQYAVDNLMGFGNQLNTLYGTPSYGPGRVSAQQAQQMSPAEVKAEEYAKYLVNKKGYTPDNAMREAQAIAADKKRKFTDDKEFKQYIRKSGEAEGLKMVDGRIQAETRFKPGGINVSPESEAIRQGMQGLAQQSLAAASGLPFMYGAEEARALQTRQALANQAMNYLGQGFETSGLTGREQANLDALKNKYLQQFGDLYKDTMRQTAGGLQESGFASSSLANEALQRGAYDPQSRFLTDALASLAEKEQGLVAQRFGMQSQNLSNMLGAFGQLGANQGIGSVLGGITNPAMAGLFTDPASAQMALALQQQNISNRMAQQAQLTGLLKTPVTYFPQMGAEEGGQLGSSIGGAAGTALGTAIGGPIGGSIGGALGGWVGGKF